MSEVSSNLVSAEERVILAADFDADFLNLRQLFQDLGSRVHGIKLGQGFLLREQAYKTHRFLSKLGARTYLDAKYEEDPDQMGSVVPAAFNYGFSKVSIAPAAGVEALVKAGEATNEDHSIFAVLPSNDKRLVDIGLENIFAANELLGEKQRIKEIACNVHDIERAKEIGDLTVMATGIRLAGDDRNDQPYIMTPSEAINAGADYLVIGRAIMGKERIMPSFEAVVENIQQAL